MMEMPAVIPVTSPDPEPIAEFVLLMLQIPPEAESINVPTEPAHTTVVPVTGDGSGFTVKVAVVIQPVGSV